MLDFIYEICRATESDNTFLGYKNVDNDIVNYSIAMQIADGSKLYYVQANKSDVQDCFYEDIQRAILYVDFNSAYRVKMNLKEINPELDLHIIKVVRH